MKKRWAATCLLSVLALTASGCGNAEYEPSPYGDETLTAPEGVTLTVENIKNSGRSCGGTFTLENGGDQVVYYGDRNLLERKDEEDGGWYSLVSYSQRTMTEPEYILSPGESVTYETDWEHLENGWHRYVMPVYLGPENGPADYETGYQLWTEFLTVSGT